MLPALVDCALYDAGRCRSCSLLPVPYAEQLARKVRAAQDALAPWPDLEWRDPVASAERGFRNKAKMVVAGRAGDVTFGILHADGSGVDLSGCPLYPASLSLAFAPMKALVNDLHVEPYDVPRRRGELKHVLLTVSEADGALMLRFVLRSRAALPALRARLPDLLAALPQLALVSVNLQPEHKAIIEGDEEIVLHGGPSLPLTVNHVPLHLVPKSFFQTNTAVAAALYREAAGWVDELAPSSVLDLFCGAGGFALHVAAPGRRVVGADVSAEAIAGAEQSRAALGLRHVRFVAADAHTLLDVPAPPDLVIVNPPRRGLGAKLSERLNQTGARYVLYSSCNVQGLARDLEVMQDWAPTRAQVFDMFPHTEHFELLVLLARSAGALGIR